MPCFNERTTVLEAANRALASPYTSELIVVDDGSTDGTRELVLGLAEPRVRVLVHPYNQGKGSALRTGLAEATGDFVIFQDADVEYNPDDYHLLLRPLLDNKADVVFGSRFHAGHPRRVLYFWHAIGNRFLATLSDALTNLNLSDIETCYKAFRKEVIQGIVIEEDRFGVEPEIAAKVARQGWRIYEVGISYAGRTYAEGKKFSWRDGLQAIFCVLRYSTLRERLHVALTGHARQPRAPAPFGEADSALEATLLSLENARNYNAWIFGLVRPHLGDEVLEIGAGHGTFTELLSGRRRLVATDLSARCIGVLRDRYGETPVIEIYQKDIEQAVELGSFDSIVLINVLEHVKDDLAAMKQLAGGLKPGGRLLLWVPASPRLYSEFDRRIGHYRRYRIKDIVSLAEDVGLDITDVRHVNLVGALAWWLVARQLRRTPTSEGGVRLYDNMFVPILRRLEKDRRPPFGQSIFCVATRP